MLTRVQCPDSLLVLLTFDLRRELGEQGLHLILLTGPWRRHFAEPKLHYWTTGIAAPQPADLTHPAILTSNRT